MGGIEESCLGEIEVSCLFALFSQLFLFLLKLYLCPMALTRATCYTKLYKRNVERNYIKLEPKKAENGKEPRQKPAQYITKAEKSSRTVKTCQAILQEHSGRRS